MHHLMVAHQCFVTLFKSQIPMPYIFELVMGCNWVLLWYALPGSGCATLTLTIFLDLEPQPHLLVDTSKIAVSGGHLHWPRASLLAEMSLFIIKQVCTRNVCSLNNFSPQVLITFPPQATIGYRSPPVTFQKYRYFFLISDSQGWPNFGDREKSKTVHLRSRITKKFLKMILCKV